MEIHEFEKQGNSWRKGKKTKVKRGGKRKEEKEKEH